MTESTVLVGFIGLGTMGGKMAANLQKAGYKIVVHDLTPLRTVGNQGPASHSRGRLSIRGQQC